MVERAKIDEAAAGDVGVRGYAASGQEDIGGKYLEVESEGLQEDVEGGELACDGRFLDLEPVGGVDEGGGCQWLDVGGGDKFVELLRP